MQPEHAPMQPVCSGVAIAYGAWVNIAEKLTELNPVQNHLGRVKMAEKAAGDVPDIGMVDVEPLRMTDGQAGGCSGRSASSAGREGKLDPPITFNSPPGHPARSVCRESVHGDGRTWEPPALILLL